MHSLRIAPSILAANLAALGVQADKVVEAGADLLHFDVMDGHFVPNLTFGAPVLRALREHGVTAPVDVHLMVAEPERFIEDFIDAGASHITVQYETTPNLQRCLSRIRDAGCTAGVALNMSTVPEVLEYVVDSLDMVLIMSINPGFGGQKFLPLAMPKLAHTRRFLDERRPEVRLEVDGGVNRSNMGEIVRAGVDTVVAGTAIFGAPDFGVAIRDLRAAAELEYASA